MARVRTKYLIAGAEFRKMTVNTPTGAGNRNRTCPSPSFDARSLKSGIFLLKKFLICVYDITRNVCVDEKPNMSGRKKLYINL
jgi:hypothetical protein